jgi:HSP20 family molecular chaperone IbpA
MPTGRCDYESWRRRADQLARKMGGDSGFGGGGLWSPPTDVFETAEGVVVMMELPGVRPGDLSIVLVDDRLVVKGCRTDPDAGRKIQYHQMEIAYGAFAKVVLLRLHYSGDEIQARMNDGYLSLTIPRAKTPSATKIAVEVRL